MIYKIKYETWKDSLEVGDVIGDVFGTMIKVLSIVKIDSYEGDTFVYVTGVKESDLE